jgi:exopolyphosphatase/guanosine-5'-triphosphate,3'-diphosphate pyrophosphatase
MSSQHPATAISNLFRRPVPEYAAAVDLGSNSFHMIVARLSDGQVHVQDRMREMVRLAAGLDKNKNLSKDAMDRALDCLERFGQRLRNMPRGSVRAVGTNTLRSTHDAKQFIALAEEKLGHPIEIISGVEEARLIYLGVAHSLAQDGLQRLVADIGGGSTELIIGESFNPRHLESLYMGCVSMTNRFFADGSITAKKIKQAEIAALMELEPISTHYKNIGWDDAVGASGTIRAINKVVTAQGWSTDGISHEALQKLVDTIAQYKNVSSLTELGISEQRAEVLPGGTMVLQGIFKALDIKFMHVSDGALREGLLLDLVGRIHHEDVRDHTVKTLAKRYHVDMAHAKTVFATAQNFLGQVADGWNLEESMSDWLEWAAMLHEIGLDIAHNAYHKHGAYILANADLAGLSRQEQQTLSLLVRSHRRKFPIKAFNSLEDYWRKPAIKLAILLRLAVLLNRGRGDVKLLPAIKLNASKKNLHLRFPDDWLDEHALTVADLEQEATWLQAAGYSLTFQ